ncbi:MAG: cation diffusion facilitator family transporter [Archaeoglobaceae archaeon]
MITAGKKEEVNAEVEDRVQGDAEEMDEALKAGKVSVIFNIIFSVLKGVAGVLVGSIALIADALHSLVDVFGSALVWVGIKLSSRPADSRYPYGYFKAESLAEAGVAIIILLSSVLIIKEGVEGLIDFSFPEIRLFAVFIALLSTGGNELLARYKISVGKRTRSTALIAEGKHSRADVLSSFSVFVGFIFVELGYWWADPLVALLISGFIIKMGLEILKSSTDTLMDRTNKDMAQNISQTVESIEGIDKVKMVATRGTWRSKIIEVQFSIKPWVTSELINQIQNKVDSGIKSNYQEVISVVPVIYTARGTNKNKIAIPSEGDNYTGDFGESKEYTIVDLDGEATSTKIIENPHLKAEKRKGYLVAKMLENEGVDTIVVNKIGEGGKAHLHDRGISIENLTGNTVQEIINKFINREKEVNQ